MKKFDGPQVWQYVVEMFDYLPIAAVIENKIFCVHGGMSPLIQRISDIDKFKTRTSFMNTAAIILLIMALLLFVYDMSIMFKFI